MASRRKATSKATGSRKVESFAGHLFYFIWNELEGGIPAKPEEYCLGKDQPSDYTPEIGKMVLKMQMDFRDDLQELFSRHLGMRMDGSNFFEFVKNNLKLLNPTDIFDRTCASCAFFSEFALYSFTKRNKDYLEMAPITWSNFFHKNLRGKFNFNGGWAELQKRATTSVTLEADLAEAPTPSGIERLQIPEASASNRSQVTLKVHQSVLPGDVITEPVFEDLSLSFPTKIVTHSPEPELEPLSKIGERFIGNAHKLSAHHQQMKLLEEKVKDPNIDEYFLKKMAQKFLNIDIGDESEPCRPPSPVSDESACATSTTLPSTSDASEHQGVKPKSKSRQQKTAMPAIRDPRTESRLSTEALRTQLLKFFEDEKLSTEKSFESSVNLVYQIFKDASKTQTREDSRRSRSSKKSGRR